MIFVFDPAHREVRTWTHGEIEGPCFIATITSMRTGEKNRAAVIECAYELQHYLSAVKDVVVEHVHMMCPPTVSGRSEWALEKLESIVVFQGVATNANAVVYRTSIASYKVGDLDLRKKKSSRVLYSPQHLQNHTPSRGLERLQGDSSGLYGPLWRK